MNDSVRNAFSILSHATKNGLPINKSSSALGFSRDLVSKTIKNTLNNIQNGVGTVTKDEYRALVEARDEFQRTVAQNVRSNGATNRRRTKGDGSNFLISTTNTNPLNLSRSEVADVEYDANVDKSYDERSKGETLRGKEIFADNNGIKLKRITGYKYKILIRNEKPLEGTLSREQMDMVYLFYSGMDGAGMTLRTVSREFPSLSFRDFKRILRAFNVTKSSLPVSPHVMEEMTSDEIVSLIHRNKEHTILKQVDNDRHKYYEKRYFDSQKEMSVIKDSFNWVDGILDGFFDKDRIKDLLKNIKPNISKRTKKTKSGKKSSTIKVGPTIFSIYGDNHYGKRFENTMYGRGYNKDIAHERIMKIAEETVAEATRKNSGEIIIISLGDLLESPIEGGMHPNHSEEMDLKQSDQVFFAAESIIKMIDYVIENTDAKITFASIHGNHDRSSEGRDEDKSRTGGKIVSGIVQRITDLKHPNRVEFIIPENNLLRLTKGNLCVFAQHGDSGLSKKKAPDLMTLFGDRERFNLQLKGHWHFLKTEEGTNSLSIQMPAVTSPDKYIQEEIGSNCLPGFIIGNEPEQGMGFDFRKITLY